MKDRVRVVIVVAQFALVPGSDRLPYEVEIQPSRMESDGSEGPK